MDLLSICIPTYNRKDRLKELLEKLCCYNKEKIKIIVIDNASTDGTDEMMQQFKNFNNILYFRNNENLGHDGNYLRIIEEGKKYSEYSLWLGDDDCLTKDFFLDIPKILIKEKPDLLLLNSKYYTNNILKRVIKNLLKINATILKIDEDIIENDLERFFEFYNDKLSFGTIIIKNIDINLKDVIKYKGTYHLYGGAIWEMFNDINEKQSKIKVYIKSKPCVIWGRGTKSYSDIMPEVCTGIGKFYAVLPEILQPAGKKMIESLIKQNTYGNNTKYIKESYFNILSKNND